MKFAKYHFLLAAVDLSNVGDLESELLYFVIPQMFEHLSGYFRS
jgi:hypothetical protein